MIRLAPMIGAFWNVRGLNKSGSLSCLGDFIKQYKLDFVGIIETKKASIADSFLRVVSNKMTWNYLPTAESAGGILVGIKTDSYDVIGWQTFQFCVVLIIRNCDDQFVWRLIVVYGSPYEETKLTFLDEIDEILGNW
jgi:hypothetical protein